MLKARTHDPSAGHWRVTEYTPVAPVDFSWRGIVLRLPSTTPSAEARTAASVGAWQLNAWTRSTGPEVPPGPLGASKANDGGPPARDGLAMATAVKKTARNDVIGR